MQNFGTADLAAILAAAGRGTRLGRPKQLLELGGKPLAAWSLEVFARCSRIGEVVVACEEQERADFEALAARFGGGKVRAVVSGGARRQDSVFAALKALTPQTRYVLVHDGARPFISAALIARVADAARPTGAALAAVPVKDTIKQVGETSGVVRTFPREQLWAAQTPQVFDYHVLYNAHAQAEIDGFVGTDDAMLVERDGRIAVVVVEGAADNIKITTPEDLAAAEIIARRMRDTGLNAPVDREIDR